MSTIRSIRSRSAGPSHATAAAVAGFLDAQHRVLERYRVDAERRFVVPTVGGCAQVLVAGEGHPLPMVIGGTLPGAFWAPLMAKLPGRTLYAIELPGFGLTDPVRYHHSTVRRTAVAFLAGVLDAWSWTRRPSPPTRRGRCGPPGWPLTGPAGSAPR